MSDRTSLTRPVAATNTEKRVYSTSRAYVRDFSRALNFGWEIAVRARISASHHSGHVLHCAQKSKPFCGPTVTLFE